MSIALAATIELCVFVWPVSCADTYHQLFLITSCCFLTADCLCPKILRITSSITLLAYGGELIIVRLFKVAVGLF